MQDLPKFVVKRLQETPPGLADSHPDADLLTAFVEHSLAQRERVRVMEHLAACSHCRDVVALALPATEIISRHVPARGSQPGWLGWPSLRWGALAAGVVAVISVGVLEYTHRLQEDRVASNVLQRYAAPGTTAALTTAAPAQASAGHSDTRSRELSLPASPQVLTAPKAATESKSGTQSPSRAEQPDAVASSARSGKGLGVGGTTFRAGSSPGEVADRGSELARATPSPAPVIRTQNAIPESRQQLEMGRADAVETMSAAPAPATESAVGNLSQNQIDQNQVAQNQADLPPNGRNATNLDVVKAKDAEAAAHGSAAKPPVASPSMPLQTSPALMLRASPRWSITPAGALQRSFDGGNTWENVNPISSSASVVNQLVSVEKAGNRADKKAGDRAGAGFHAVAASGLEVWAGGSAGLLLHTSDGGASWIRVSPVSDGVALRGDIVSIQFSDTQHGRVTTSAPELWITSDAGQTWQKQP